MAGKGREWSARRNAEAGGRHAQLSKDRTPSHSTISLTDALPVQERCRDSEQRREDVGRSAESRRLHCGWKDGCTSSSELQSASVFFFFFSLHANKGQRDHPLYINLCPAVPPYHRGISSKHHLSSIYSILWPVCFVEAMFSPMIFKYICISWKRAVEETACLCETKIQVSMSRLLEHLLFHEYSAEYLSFSLSSCQIQSPTAYISKLCYSC